MGSQRPSIEVLLTIERTFGFQRRELAEHSCRRPTSLGRCGDRWVAQPSERIGEAHRAGLLGLRFDPAVEEALLEGCKFCVARCESAHEA
jgi:hypothetical protein